MKKSLFAILAFAGLAQVSFADAYYTNDSYEFVNGQFQSLGKEALAELQDGGSSFAISYELVSCTLNDVVEAGGVFFELTAGSNTLSVGYNSMLGFFTSGIGGVQMSSYVPFIPDSVPFLFQYDSDSKKFTFSYYMEYDSDKNPHDLTEIISANLGDNNVFETGISSGSFAITVPTGSVSEIRTWTGVVTADDLANPTPAPSVPEPTTATLSLLALAGLAARRRRK